MASYYLEKNSFDFFKQLLWICKNTNFMCLLLNPIKCNTKDKCNQPMTLTQG